MTQTETRRNGLTYQEFINKGPHPDESDTWQQGDILEFGGGGRPDATRTVRFDRLDPDDPIGFYAAAIDDDGRVQPVSRCWTRGRFILKRGRYHGRARMIRGFAFIARRAARAEESVPEAES